MMRFTMQKRFFRTLQIVLLSFPVPLKFAYVSSILLFFSSFQQPGETTYTHCGTVLERFRINVGNLPEWRRVIIQDAERGKTRGHRARMVIKTEEREREREQNGTSGKEENRGAVPKYGLEGRGAQVWYCVRHTHVKGFLKPNLQPPTIL